MTVTKHQQFLDLLETYKNRIFRICGAYASTSHDQEDLFQEVVVNLWQSLDSFQGHSQIYTWIYRVTINICMRNQYRKKRTQERQVRLNSVHFVKPDMDDMQVRVEERQQIDTLYQCIHQLQKTDKSIILLFLEELPYREIAEIIGISENHVAVKVKRIKAKLYECLKQQGYD